MIITSILIEQSPPIEYVAKVKLTSFEIIHEIGDRFGTASFIAFGDPATLVTEITSNVGVQIYAGATLLFAGRIVRIQPTAEYVKELGTGQTAIAVTCVDNSSVLQTAIITSAVSYSETADSAIIAAMFALYLPSFDLTAVATVGSSIDLEVPANSWSLRDLLNQISSRTGAVWYVSEDSAALTYSAETATAAAFGIGETDGSIPNGQTWSAESASSNSAWVSVAYGAGLFVAIRSGTGLMTSPDGITWTARSGVLQSNSWNSVCYGGGLFVIVGGLGTGTQCVATSPDGIAWTARTGAANNFWNSVVYGGGVYVAVSEDGTNRVMTSPDGITWTSRSAAAAKLWQSVTYGNSIFVAVARNGDVMTSPTGATWTARTPAASNTWYSVVYGALFVAVAQSGTDRVMTSPDGITWTSRSASEANNWQSVAYGSGLYVAISSNGTNRVMTSTDGITWTARAASEANAWQGVAYGSGVGFAAVSNSGTHRVMLSADSPTHTAIFGTVQNTEEWTTPGNRIKVYGVADSDGNRLTVTRNDTASQALYGILEGKPIVNDQIITIADADAIGDQYLAKFAFPIISGSYQIDTDGLRVGRSQSIILPSQLLNGNYLIRKIRLQWPDNDLTRYTVDFGDWRPDITRKLAQIDRPPPGAPSRDPITPPWMPPLPHSIPITDPNTPTGLCGRYKITLDCDGLTIRDMSGPMAIFAVGPTHRGTWWRSFYRNGAWTTRTPFYDYAKAAGADSLGGWTSSSLLQQFSGSNQPEYPGFSAKIVAGYSGPYFIGYGLPKFPVPLAIDNSISPSDFDIASDFCCANNNIFYAQGAWWLIASYIDRAPAPDVFYRTAIFKSTGTDVNGRPTGWAIQDLANTPNNAGAGFVEYEFRWDGGTTIRVFGTFNGTDCYLWDFDMITKTWSDSPGTGHGHVVLATAASSGRSQGGLAVLPNGDTLVFYRRSAQVFCRTFSAGSWGAETAYSDVVGGENREFSNLVVDANTVHAFYMKNPGGSFGATNDNLVYRPIVGGVPGTAHTFGNNSGISNGTPSVTIMGNAIYVMYDDRDAEDATIQGNRVYIGTPLSAPAWTGSVVYNAPTGNADDDPSGTYVTLGVDADGDGEIVFKVPPDDPVTETADFQIVGGPDLYLVDATAAAITATLPTATGRPGVRFTIKKIDSTGNAVIIAAIGSQTIDGASTVATSTQYGFFTVESNGHNWFVISS